MHYNIGDKFVKKIIRRLVRKNCLSLKLYINKGGILTI